MPKAVVVGAGVAGPVVAHLLRRDGWEAPVLEARPGADPYEGLFLNVAANGRRVLASLGLERRLLTDAHPAGSMVMWSGRGQQLGVVPNGPVGQPQNGGVVARRGWLHQVIAEGAEKAGVRIQHGRRLLAVEQDGSGVAARFDDGHTEEGDIIVGADGIGSAVREHIAPGVIPSFSGLLGTGGFARVPGLEPTPGVQHMVFGARSFFGYLVRADGTVYWFANVTADEPPAAGASAESGRDWLPRLRELHADDPFPVPQILEQSAGPVAGYPIFRLPTVPTWWRGRAVAVGDAVHASSPSAGQGASLALEDAVVLATSLRGHAGPREAFAAYEKARRQRAEAVVAYAARIDKQKRVAKGRVGVALRDALLPIFLRKAARDARNDWVYAFEVPETA
jgi:2-polyprenyl-6-methoxyphenol hydroxylase-like FAD-dependent oxidoreductase